MGFFSAFLNPWTMAAGTALVATPIVIHLINRMRYRRVRWAAMEFLLRAQKRMKRKLIIEQLLLLLLRCLLVFLIAVLAARFPGFGDRAGKESRAGVHVVVLDDSPSMGEVWTPEGGGQPVTPFAEAKKVVADQLAPALAQAAAPQRLFAFRMSAPDDKLDLPTLDAGAVEKLTGFLAPLQPSTVRTPLPDVLKKAKAVLDTHPDADAARTVHVVADLRAVDWAEDGEAIKAAMEGFAAAGVGVNLIDAARPFRKKDEKSPAASENLGVTGLRVLTRTAVKGLLTPCEVRVRNFGTTQAENVRVRFLVNGTEDPAASVVFPKIPPNQEAGLKFQVRFDRTATPADPLTRFSLLTAEVIASEADGLKADNLRHAVVEVRDAVPVLLVENSPIPTDKTGVPLFSESEWPTARTTTKEAQGFYFRKFVGEAIGGVVLVDGTEKELETLDLKRFAAVYLLNVETLAEPAVKNLEGYVRAGGGVGVFLGPDVKPAEYTRLLYRGGKGLFPLPLAAQAAELTDDQKRRRDDPNAPPFNQILPRDGAAQAHPALEGLYFNDNGTPQARPIQFPAIKIDRYWTPDPNDLAWQQDRTVRELFCLANHRTNSDYEPELNRLATRLRDVLKEPKYRTYREVIDDKAAGGHGALLANALDAATDNARPLTSLSFALDNLLRDQLAIPDEAEKPRREFWALPELSDLKGEFARLRDAMKFGDPLYVAKDFGRGRVTVVTTTAGERWTDWASAHAYKWGPVLVEMQKYLAGGGGDDDRACGRPVGLDLEAGRYDPKAGRRFVTFDPALATADKPLTDDRFLKDPKADESATNPSDPVNLTARGDGLALDYPDTARPGAYLFTLTRKKKATDPPATPDAEPEYHAVAVNIDARREGAVRRADRAELIPLTPGAEVRAPDDREWLDRLRQRPEDLSSNRWLYLVLLLVLVAEQAMAVRLSRHAAPDDAAALAPSAVARETVTPV